MLISVTFRETAKIFISILELIDDQQQFTSGEPGLNLRLFSIVVIFVFFFFFAFFRVTCLNSTFSFTQPWFQTFDRSVWSLCLPTRFEGSITSFLVVLVKRECCGVYHEFNCLSRFLKTTFIHVCLCCSLNLSHVLI